MRNNGIQGMQGRTGVPFFRISSFMDLMKKRGDRSFDYSTSEYYSLYANPLVARV